MRTIPVACSADGHRWVHAQSCGALGDWRKAAASKRCHCIASGCACGPRGSVTFFRGPVTFVQGTHPLYGRHTSMAEARQHGRSGVCPWSWECCQAPQAAACMLGMPSNLTRVWLDVALARVHHRIALNAGWGMAHGHAAACIFVGWFFFTTCLMPHTRGRLKSCHNPCATPVHHLII